MAKILRERIVAELTGKYGDTRNCVFIDFSGLDVEAMSQLRRQMNQKGIEFFVVKNSLLKLALENAGLPTVDELFVRSTAMLTGGDDPIIACKLIVDWQKKTKSTEIKGGLLECKLLTSEQVVELSKVPSREVLLSQILGLFISPMSDIAGLLNNTIAQFANLLHNHIDKKEG